MTNVSVSETAELDGVDRRAASAAAPIARPEVVGASGSGILYAALAWGAAAAVTIAWPDIKNFKLTTDIAVAELLLGALLVASFALGDWLRGVARWLRFNAPRLIALAALVSIWQVASAKTGWWPQPYFPPPQSLVEVYVNDWPRLLECVKSSLVLLVFGSVLGSSVGFLTGLSIGWSQNLGYWVHPILRLIGPVPSTALIPIVLFVFPTSFSASVFLIALATWFPVSILTWSGVASVESSYYDVARTLGGNARFLLLKVAIPASLPNVFVGLFMGLGHAIAVLVVAEMLGVKSGLGFYLQWAQGWAAYDHLYAALAIMALLFSGVTTLLFKTRDRVLIWQKGVVNW